MSNILENTDCGSVPQKSKIVPDVIARILGQWQRVEPGGDV